MSQALTLNLSSNHLTHIVSQAVTWVHTMGFSTQKSPSTHEQLSVAQIPVDMNTPPVLKTDDRSNWGM
jgi:hypothetical protein